MKTHDNDKSSAAGATMPLDKNAKRRKRLKTAGRVLVLALCLGVLAVAGGAIGFSVWADGVDLDKTLLPTASAMPVFLDIHGNRIDYRLDNYLSPDEIPDNVRAAFVALEDKRFYEHEGYDLRRMAGAALHNIKAGRAVEGASTITQQLVKNTHLSAEKTLKRKMNEIALAMKVEQSYSKDEILAMYLSVIYFGGGAYGIKAASRLYFGCAPEELSVAQAATLAGILRNPSKYSPRNSIKNATSRRDLVLEIMAEQGYITPEEKEAAKSERIRLATTADNGNAYKFYIDRVIAEATAALGITKYTLDNSGYTIITNMDCELQRALAEEADAKENFSADGVDSAAVVIDNATGAVTAHYSSLSYSVYRQAGSVAKPLLVYAPAFDCGAVAPGSPVVDERTDFGGWSPENYGGVYYGETTPREALKKSMNTVAVKIMSYTGVERSLGYGKAFGLELGEQDCNLSSALGASHKGVGPVTLAAAYSALARGGSYIAPRYIASIVDRGGKKIYAPYAAPVRVIGEDAAYLTTDCLIDTVKSGTARSMGVLPFCLAAKTGTVEKASGKNTDAWNLSYTTQHTLAVWHGASELNERGGGHATRHAVNVWKKIYSGAYPKPFAAPSSVVERKIDTYSTAKNRKLTLAGKYTPSKYLKTELFSAKFPPSADGSLFDTPLIPEISVETLGGAVRLKFAAEEIYVYTVTCSDVFGDRQVAEIDGGGGAGAVCVDDRPYSLGGAVTYTLTVRPVGVGAGAPSSEIEKRVFVAL